MQKYGRETHEGMLNHGIADNLVSMHLARVQRFDPPDTQQYEGKGWSYYLRGMKQEFFNLDLFYDLTYGANNSRPYWMKRHNMTNQVFELVDWETISDVLSTWYMFC